MLDSLCGLTEAFLCTAAKRDKDTTQQKTTPLKDRTDIQTHTLQTHTKQLACAELLSLSLSLTHTYTHTHTHIYVLSLSHTHTHTHTFTFQYNRTPLVGFPFLRTPLQ